MYARPDAVAAKDAIDEEAAATRLRVPWELGMFKICLCTKIHRSITDAR